MWSRLASRVMWRSRIPCDDEDTLYRTIAALPGRPPRGRVAAAVDAKVSGEGITHARYAALRVKDASSTACARRHRRTPDVDVEAPDRA